MNCGLSCLDVVVVVVVCVRKFWDITRANAISEGANTMNNRLNKNCMEKHINHIVNKISE